MAANRPSILSAEIVRAVIESDFLRPYEARTFLVAIVIHPQRQIGSDEAWELICRNRFGEVACSSLVETFDVERVGWDGIYRRMKQLPLNRRRLDDGLPEVQYRPDQYVFFVNVYPDHPNQCQPIISKSIPGESIPSLFRTGKGEVVNLDEDKRVFVQTRETDPGLGNIRCCKVGRPTAKINSFMGESTNGGIFLGFYGTVHILRRTDHRTLCLLNSSEHSIHEGEHFQCEDEWEINNHGRGMFTRAGNPLLMTHTGLCLLDSIRKEEFCFSLSLKFTIPQSARKFVIRSEGGGRWANLPGLSSRKREIVTREGVVIEGVQVTACLDDSGEDYKIRRGITVSHFLEQLDGFGTGDNRDLTSNSYRKRRRASWDFS